LTAWDSVRSVGTLGVALEEAGLRFRAANPQSLAQHERAIRCMPGGNTRSVLFNDPFPITLVGGKEARVRSLDGREYLDFLGEYTAGLYGHTNAVIAAAIQRAVAGGLTLGGQTQVEEEFASLLCERFPALSMLRFTNSGTEANLLAIAAALEFTGRQVIVVFEGGYHGSVLNFAAGRARNAPHDFVVLPYNDAERFETAMSARADDIAAVLVEPMLGSGGCIPASPGFLSALREVTSRHGALLIFDEVMTSRLGPSGLGAAHRIEPDLMTLGKYLGGGLGCGAFGGRADIMSSFDPRRPRALQHAGTFNNNICSMSAGLAGVRDVFTPAASIDLNRRGDTLRLRMQSLILKSGLPISITGLGSMMQVHMHPGPITNYSAARLANGELRDLFYYDLIANGIWSARRGMLNLSLPMTDEDCQQLLAAVDDFIVERCELFP
jgi:glutamate-1-semialdehyde 2,1-aminomutase